MTVSDLIDLLSRLDPDLPVEMSMNMEYQCKVKPYMIVVETDGVDKYLCITNCPN